MPTQVDEVAKVYGITRERIRQIIIIAVNPRNNLAGRPRKTLVDRVRLPAIRFADPVRQPFFVLANDLDRAIRAAAIHHNIL